MNILQRMLIRANEKKEDGFTLFELLIVIAVIGILSLMAIPVFIHQREAAAVASVKSDLRNAGMMMEQSLLTNNNRYPSYIPNYSQQSEGTKLKLDMATSNQQKFCIKGTHNDYANIKYSYDSSMGGVLPPVQNCVTPTGNTWALEMKTKKALIVYTQNDDYRNLWTNKLKAAGFQSVDYKFNASPLEYKNYDLIVAASSAWSLPAGVVANIDAGYNMGNSVLVEGNDNSSTVLPKIISVSEHGSTMGELKMEKTRNPARPAFPYTFDTYAFKNDASWVCPTKLVPGAVSTTTSPKPGSPSTTCITSGVLANDATGGRYAYMMMFSNTPDGESFLTELSQWMLTK